MLLAIIAAAAVAALPFPPVPVAPAPPPAAAQPPSARIAKPNWVRRPSGDDAERLYPARASRQSVGGRVVLLCEVRVDGALTACRVLEETPPDYGFGDAALKMAALFKMAPVTDDGQSVAGATVTIPLAFRPAGDEQPPMPPPPPVDLTTPLSYDEAVLCHTVFAWEVEHLDNRSRIPLRAAARALAIELGGARGVSRRDVEKRLREEPEDRIMKDLHRIGRCEMIH